MIYFLIVLFSLIAVICLLLLAKTRIMVEYRMDNFKIIFRNSFLKYTLDSEKFARMGKKKNSGHNNVDVKVKKEPEPTEERIPEKFFEKVERYKAKYLAVRGIADAFLRAMRYRLSFSELYVGITYGTGDAASTGMLYGTFWGLIGSIYAFLCRFFYLPFPEVELKPLYDKKEFRIEAEGIITVRLVHIIIAAVRSYIIYRKHKNESSKQGGN